MNDIPGNPELGDLDVEDIARSEAAETGDTPEERLNYWQRTHGTGSTPLAPESPDPGRPPPLVQSDVNGAGAERKRPEQHAVSVMQRLLCAVLSKQTTITISVDDLIAVKSLMPGNRDIRIPVDQLLDLLDAGGTK